MKHNALVLALGIAPSFAYGQSIERINPDGLTKPTTYSHVVKVGNLLFIAGQVAFDSAGNLVGENDMKAQVRQVLENLKTALASQRADFSNVVKINIFTTDVEAFSGCRGSRRVPGDPRRYLVRSRARRPACWWGLRRSPLLPGTGRNQSR
jgi:enamine deaminase RidA (YjgF/YER057c/UK114 family)